MKTKLKIDIHSKGVCNNVFYSLVENHNSGKSLANMDLIKSVLDSHNYFLRYRENEETSTVHLFENNEPTISIQQISIVELVNTEA